MNVLIIFIVYSIIMTTTVVWAFKKGYDIGANKPESFSEPKPKKQILPRIPRKKDEPLELEDEKNAEIEELNNFSIATMEEAMAKESK